MKPYLYVALLFVIIGLVACGKPSVTGNAVREAGGNSNEIAPEPQDDPSGTNILQDTQDTENDQPSASTTGRKTASEVIMSLTPQKCTFEKSEGPYHQTMVIYVANQNFYEEVIIEDSSGGMNAWVIKNGEWVYTWNDRVPGGRKFKLTPEDMQKPDTNVQGMDPNYQYTCVPWAVDRSLFEPPTDISFGDLTDDIADMPAYTAEDAQAARQNMCDLCDNAPTEEARAQCREGVGC